MAPSTQSNSEDSPASCPAVRGSPRCSAQRPLPSMTMATWPGTFSGGSCGGRDPAGGGRGGVRSRRGAPRPTRQNLLELKRGVLGKGVEPGGRRFIKKKKCRRYL